MTAFCNSQWFEVTSCGKDGCGQIFAMSKEFYDARQRDGATWYCPSGHPRVFRETEAQRLKAELARAHTDVDRAREAEAMQRQKVAQISRSYQRVRTRIRNGVCPCCNRTFDNLARHMSTQHADYGETKTLRAVRNAFGLTQAQLASEAGVPTPYVSHFERGTDLPRWAKKKIADWLAQQTAAA
jgi:DNA-binding XRE family transcriptional regulator